MDHIQHCSVEKIVKMLERGLDPNFHDLETGGRARAWGTLRKCGLVGESGSLMSHACAALTPYLVFRSTFSLPWELWVKKGGASVPPGAPHGQRVSSK